MKIFKIILILVLLFSMSVFAKLSDETLEEVRKLSYKHYGYYKGDLVSTDILSVANDSIEWTRDFLSIWVEDGKLFIETQDGKWFIEMEKVEE